MFCVCWATSSGCKFILFNSAISGLIYGYHYQGYILSRCRGYQYTPVITVPPVLMVIYSVRCHGKMLYAGRSNMTLWPRAVPPPTRKTHSTNACPSPVFADTDLASSVTVVAAMPDQWRACVFDAGPALIRHCCVSIWQGCWRREAVLVPGGHMSSTLWSWMCFRRRLLLH